MQHENLRIRPRTGTDADGRHRHAPGDFGAKRVGNRLHQHHPRAGLGQRLRILGQLRRRIRRLALPLEATELADMLRRQPDMRADWNRPRREELHRLHHDGAAFELDDIGTRLEQRRGAGEGLGRSRLETAERQIGHDQTTGRAARHHLGVIGHLFQADAQGVGMALDRHAKRIADQDAVDSRGFGKLGESEIIGGNQRPLMAFGAGLVPA